jgi:hypothetical protein
VAEMKIWVVLFSLCTGLFAQTATVPNTSKAELGDSLYKHLKKNLRIRYFSEFLGSSPYKLDDNQPDATTGEKTADPINLWNQISFNYHFGYKMNLVVNPRFTLQIGDKRDLTESATQDTDTLYWEDWLVGFQGVVYTNGNFAYFARAGSRIPMSKFSRNTHMVAQPEYFHDFNYTINKEWSVGMWQMNRFYVYDKQGTNERRRHYFAPYFNYSINDKAKVEVYYEYEVQHNQPKGKRDWNYLNKNFSDIYAGVSFVLSPSLSLYPFFIINDQELFDHKVAKGEDFDPLLKTTKMGMWIMATLF